MGVWCHAALFPASEKKAAAVRVQDELRCFRWCKETLFNLITALGLGLNPFKDSIDASVGCWCCSSLLLCYMLQSDHSFGISCLLWRRRNQPVVPPKTPVVVLFFLRDLLNYLEGLIINIYRNNVPILPLLQFSQLTIRFFGNLSFSLNYIEINKQLKTVLRWQEYFILHLSHYVAFARCRPAAFPLQGFLNYVSHHSLIENTSNNG